MNTHADIHVCANEGHEIVLSLILHTEVAQVHINGSFPPVQGSAVFPGRPLVVCLQRLRVVTGCQVCGLESKQPVLGNWQLRWKSKYTLVVGSTYTLHTTYRCITRVKGEEKDLKRREMFFESPNLADLRVNWSGGLFVAGKASGCPFYTAAELYQAWSPLVPLSTRTICGNMSLKSLCGQTGDQKSALNKGQIRKIWRFRRPTAC